MNKSKGVAVMFDIFKLEIKKIIFKKDMMLIMIVLAIVPFIFSFCMVNKVAGLNFAGLVSEGDFGLMIWSFLKYLFVLYLVPIYMAASFLGKEVENRSIQLMLTNKKRISVIVAKIIAYILVLTVFFIAFQSACILSYQIFIAGSELEGTSIATTMSLAFIYGFQWLEMIFVLLVSVALCCVIKGNAVLVLGLVVVIIEKILANLDGIKRLLPYSISDYTTYMNISSSKLMATNTVSVVIYAVIFAALLYATAYIWKKRDF